MNVILYKLNKRINSTKTPDSSTASLTVDNVKLKESTSIEKPTLKLKLSYENAIKYNYAKFENTYYFITDVVSVNNDVVEIVMDKDVLATYKREIKSYTAFVERSSDTTHTNNMVNDTLLSQSVDIAKVSRTPTNVYFINNGTYVLRTISGNGVENYVTENYPANFFDFLFPEPIPATSIWDVFDDVKKATYDPMKYVLDYYLIPISKQYMQISLVGDISIKAGLLASDPVSAQLVGHMDNEYFYTTNGIEIEKPNNYFNDWRDFDDSWSNYSIYIPFIGQIPVPARYFQNILKVYYYIDFFTCEVNVRLVMETGEGTALGIIGEYNSNCKINLQMASAGNSNANMVSGIGKVLGETAKAFATGDLGGIVGATTETIKNEISPMPQSVGGFSGNRAAIFHHKNIVVSCVRYSATGRATRELGNPVYKNVLLSNMNGFIKCANASVPLQAIEGDIVKVNSYLNSGFYIE